MNCPKKEEKPLGSFDFYVVFQWEKNTLSMLQLGIEERLCSND